MNYTEILLIPFIPLAVFLMLGIFYNRIKPAVSGIVGVLGLLISTLLSINVAYQYFFVLGNNGEAYQAFVHKTAWMNFTETLKIDMGVLLDPISIMMLLVVSIVSLMVHLYSRGYMKGDPGYTKFFAFLSLFTFSMYGLVLATNLFQIYIFLGAGRGIIISADRVLLYQTIGSGCSKESVYRNTFCRPWLSDRNPYHWAFTPEPTILNSSMIQREALYLVGRRLPSWECLC